MNCYSVHFYCTINRKINGTPQTCQTFCEHNFFGFQCLYSLSLPIVSDKSKALLQFRSYIQFQSWRIYLPIITQVKIVTGVEFYCRMLLCSLCFRCTPMYFELLYSIILTFFPRYTVYIDDL